LLASVALTAVGISSASASEPPSAPLHGGASTDELQNSTDGLVVNPGWGRDRIDQRALPLDEKFSTRFTGAGVDVYVVSTGIRSTHRDVAGRVKTGWYVDFGDNTKTGDCVGRGTSIASTIGGKTYGVAPGVSIVPVKVASCTDLADGQDFINAVKWVANDHQPGQPAVAMLDGSGPGNLLIDSAVAQLIDDGVTVVAPASEDTYWHTCVASPQEYEPTITVASSTKDDDRTFLHNTCVDLYAPGQDITSASNSSDTATAAMSGPSMAAAHVAGAAALILEERPAYTPSQVWATLDAETTKGAIAEPTREGPGKLLYVTDRPWAPTGLQGAVAPATGMGSGEVKLSWTAPTDPGAAPITDYVIEYSTDGSSWGRIVDGVSTATTSTVTMLTNGTRYSFRVAAVNEVGDGDWSTTMDATPAWKPGAPTGLTAAVAPAEGVGSGQVKLTWDAPVDDGGADITDYIIQFRRVGTTGWFGKNDGESADTTALVGAFTNGTRYEFRILAWNAVGVGLFSGTVQATPLWTPTAPTGVTTAVVPAAGVGSGQVKLTWCAPEDDGGQLTDYVIEQSLDGVTWTTANDEVSTATTSTVSGLTNGAKYTFRVAAKNSVGIGPRSPTIEGTPKGPFAPTGLSAVIAPSGGVGSGQVKLTWSAPADNTGVAAIGDYVIQRLVNGTTWTTINDGKSAATSYTVSNLGNGTQYTFRVAGQNLYGAGNWSDQVQATPRGEPGPPGGLTAAVAPAAGVGSGEVRLSWTAPAGDNGAPVTDYRIDWSTNGQLWMTFDDGVSTATTATVTGLTNGTPYRLAVTARNIVGGRYGIQTEATPVWTPEAPDGLTAVVAPADGLQSGEVKLSWSAPSTNGSAITDYRIEWSFDGQTWTTADDGVSTATTATVGGLTDFTSYTFRVAAQNGVGTGPKATVEGTPLRAPSALDELSADVAPTPGLGSGEVRLAWTAPPAEQAATDYVIEFSLDGETWTTVTDGVSTATTYTVGGLADGTSYTFRVAAVNAVGTGGWSGMVTATPMRTPDTPGGLRAERAGSGEVVLNWLAASPAITDYVIEYSPDGVDWITYPDEQSTATTIAVTGLTNGTPYAFRLAARNALGTSAWTDAVSATPAWLPAAPTWSRSAVAPSPGVGSGQVRLTWAAPQGNGSAITDYVLQRAKGGRWITVVDGVSARPSALLSQLSNGARYSFRVAAVNGLGRGQWSGAIPATPRWKPTAARALTAAAGTGRVILNWRAPSSAGGSSLTDYVIQIAKGQRWSTVRDGVSTTRTRIITRLTNGTTYRFRVAAKNDVGRGPWSAVVRSTPRP
jgi:titin